MQVLWSRAVQARSTCRCRSCLHATTTLARRTTTAASKRRVRVSDVLTACYSTILATAAFADARVKEDRRKEWDRLIEEVKKPSKPEDVQPMSETDNREIQKPQEYNAETTSESISTYIPVQDQMRQLLWSSGLPALGERISGLDWKLRNATAERIALRDVDSPHEIGINEVGQWVDELLDPDLENREPKTPLHISKYEEMVRDLVNSVLHQSKVFSKDGREENSSLKTRQELSKMAKLFLALKSRPYYTYDNLEVIAKERRKLHRSLWALCFAASNGQTDVNVAITKVCYNMLVCPAPPTITTYNILLNEFMRLGRSDLAQLVVDSFLHESRLKPTKKTLRLFLDHYRAKSDFAGFRDIIQRMRAGKEDIRIRRRHISEMSNRKVAFWASNNPTIHRSGFIMQKAPLSNPIYESLILGSLEFNLVRSAVRHARNCLREGCEISAETLCAVIKRIVNKLDAYAGASLLKAIASQWNDGSIVSLTIYTKDLRRSINQLLLLCGINPDSGPSRSLLPPGVSPTALSQILRRMRLGTLVDTIECSASFILRLDAALGMSGLDFAYAKITPKAGYRESPSQRLDWALQITRKQSKAEKRRGARKMKSKYDGRQLRFRVLNNMVDSASVGMHTLQTEVLEINIEVKKRLVELLDVCAWRLPQVELHTKQLRTKTKQLHIKRVPPLTSLDNAVFLSYPLVTICKKNKVNFQTEIREPEFKTVACSSDLTSVTTISC